MNGGDDSMDRLREGVASLLEIKGDGEGCPSAATIWDSAADNLEPGENEAILIHLGECAACSAAWRLAHRLYQEETGAGRKAVVVPFRRRRWIPLAAAAVIVLGAGLGTLHFLTRPEAPPEYRVQEDRWLESELELGRPLPRDECVLRWTSGPEGTTYDLMLTTEDLDPVIEARGLGEPEYRVDPRELELVAPGDAILWRVTANLPDGRRVSSPTFTTQLE
jgi:hypothetical protein